MHIYSCLCTIHLQTRCIQHVRDYGFVFFLKKQNSKGHPYSGSVPISFKETCWKSGIHGCLNPDCAWSYTHSFSWIIPPRTESLLVREADNPLLQQTPPQMNSINSVVARNRNTAPFAPVSLNLVFFQCTSRTL